LSQAIDDSPEDSRRRWRRGGREWEFCCVRKERFVDLMWLRKWIFGVQVFKKLVLFEPERRYSKADRQT
jgi:hypothetical protein